MFHHALIHAVQRATSSSAALLTKLAAPLPLAAGLVAAAGTAEAAASLGAGLDAVSMCMLPECIAAPLAGAALGIAPIAMGGLAALMRVWFRSFQPALVLLFIVCDCMQVEDVGTSWNSVHHVLNAVEAAQTASKHTSAQPLTQSGLCSSAALAEEPALVLGADCGVIGTLRQLCGCCQIGWCIGCL